MAIKLQSTRDLSLKHGVKCLVYGPSGVGKTRLIASAPSPVVISAESGLLALRQFNIPAITVTSLKELVEVYDWVFKSREAAQFQTLCLDSVSEIAEVVLADEKKKTKDGRKAYGDAQDSMVSLFRSFRDIQGKHVYFSAKQERITDANGAIVNAPMFPGNKLAQAAPYFFDEVFQLCNFKNPNSGEFERWFRTQSDNQNVAKDRSGLLQEWESADPKTNGGLAYIFHKMTQG